jgi:hypothetical protein
MKYFSDSHVTSILELCENNRHETVGVLRAFGREITHAIHTLAIPSRSWERENLPSLVAPGDYAEFEGVWFPEYQRYAEHAFNHLINLPLGVLERIHKKQYCGMALTKRAECLVRFGLASLVEGFRAPVRNAISHGNTEFVVAGIRFIDTNATEELVASEFLRLYDGIVASCNAIAVAMLLFLIRNHHLVDDAAVPLGATLLALRGAASYAKLSVDRLIPTETVGGGSQLNIVCSAAVPSRAMQMFDALHLAACAQDLGASAYERVGITFDTGHSVSGSVFLDGRRLARARANSEPDEVLGEIVETDLLWHDSSTTRRRLATWGLLFRLGLAKLRSETRDRQAEKGVTPLGLLYSVRHVENKSVKGLRRVEAILVLEWGTLPSAVDLLGIARHAIGRLRWRPIASVGIGTIGLPLRRPRYVWIKLFRHDAAYFPHLLDAISRHALSR